MSRSFGPPGVALAFLQQSDPAGGGARPSLLETLVPIILVVIIVYFLLIRPASKKQKAVQAMIESLKNGDKVITTGGIHGVVAGITDDIIQLRVATNVKIDVSRNAIAALQKED
ncbi:MAG TPA: preprotein translocase subunit YajC [Candidatus Polarisedimenticolia bacterium]|nr:preprotein translocase subunit YajC [Candidatus Polarisedimenticolia bacterium]